jgi:small subunit ribosomal protein S1
VVDVGVKRDGFVAMQDIERLDPKFLKSLKVGDAVPVYVLNPSDRDGNLLVSINLGLEGQDWLRAQQLLESGDMVEAEVIGYNRGGLLVRFGRLEGFVPSSHAADLEQGLNGTDRRDAMDHLIGGKIGLKVIEVNQGRRRLILSQREAQREWRSRQKERLLDNLKVGDVVTGRVTGVRDFGVFVDIGGADGLIHVSELAWHRVPHPRDVVEVGDEIRVHVLELDQGNQRIALSLRRTLSDPWDIVNDTYQIDQIVEGTVSNVVDFGAFVVLPDGIEGLLHITEMADGTLTEPHSYLQRGDKVTVRIVRIEPERRRIGFTQQGLNMSRPTDEPNPDAVMTPVRDLAQDHTHTADEDETPNPSAAVPEMEEAEIDDFEDEDDSED